MTQRDSTHILQEQVRQAKLEQQALVVRGGGTKSFYGYPVEGERLKLKAHAGILDYSPTELVLTARAGTPLAEVDAALARHGQMLGCEPPHFGQATFGGMIASGLAGPRRPVGGGVADQILGCRLLNGQGEILRFGGRVMKNVAGYDISRLMAGSLGCLGVILDATVRVRPRPAAECSVRFDLEAARIAPFVNNLARLGYPVSASCHDGRALAVRFSAGTEEIAGLEPSLRRHFAFIGFEEERRADFWQRLREQQLDFFRGEGNLWRLSLPPAAPDPGLPGESLVEWNGALRWLRTEAAGEDVFAAAAALNGSATLFRTARPERAKSIFQPLSAPLLQWHRGLKQAFDPAGIFNPGRMYREI